MGLFDFFQVDLCYMNIILLILHVPKLPLPLRRSPPIQNLTRQYQAPPNYHPQRHPDPLSRFATIPHSRPHKHPLNFPLATMQCPKLTPKLPLLLRRSPPKSNTPIQSPRPTVIPNCVPIHSAILPGCQMRTNRQTDRQWCVAVHCGNVTDGLQTLVLYGACSANSTPCGGVHHILSPIAIIGFYYANVYPI